MLMPRDIPLHGHQSSAPFKKTRNFKGKLKPRLLKVCPVYITMMGLAHIRSIMRLEVFIISTFAVLALLMRADPVLTVLLNVGRRIKKNK